MIAYELVRPYTTTQPAPVFNLNPVNLHNQPIPRPSVEKPTPWEPLGMGKMQYVDWLNHNIYPQFPKGSRVTLRSLPYLVDHLPSVVFIVKEIQEIHYMVQLDREAKQPKALGIVNADFPNDIPVYYPPALLRRLNQQEEEHLDKLRAKKESQIVTVDEWGRPLD